MIRSTTLAPLALASALVLAGCGTTGDESTSGVSGAATSTATATASATSASPSGAGISAEHNDQDLMFARAMRVHHEQAVAMSQTLLAKQSIPEEVRQLAEGVIAAQGPEIEQMDRMLQAWDASATAEPGGMEGMDHGSMDGGSDGMIGEEDLDRLESAQGTEAARLYLEQMTVHHEGAIDMARQQATDGANPEAIELAEDVVAAQEAEIAEMDRMLQELPAES
ncbi:DUF305 domain-containing protein [Kocuria oceani]|uniref:DUF305 domain-containing protein n=1 Tax=Kocuria oceani TaxID=988827 RepID=A0ABV9TF41_9MICC|nr:DUF305 domain-containing protein [Kocuria oceani]